MSSTLTTLLKTKGFAIPSALDYTKVFAQIGSTKSNVSSQCVGICKCNCACSCDGCVRSISVGKNLTW